MPNVNNAATMWYIQHEVKRKVNHAEADIRRIEQMLERNTHVQSEPLRLATERRLKQELEHVKHTLARLKRNGHPF